MYTKYPMGNIFSNENQLQEWVEAAEGIKDRFGIDKALGYLIGEKFYTLVDTQQFSRKRIRNIDEERKFPDYNPIRERIYGNRKFVENLDETYEAEKERIAEAADLLIKFTGLIKSYFEPYEIKEYFESHPRLGVHGHIATDEEFDFLVSKGAIEHSIDTEIDDAIIFGKMKKYFGIV
ncbi:MAG: hypothetical protein RDU01_07985 [Thermodesulfovibrionales bacterium]|nr:hypothetical protein [Thermodesulfovibrionales bacterium]